MFEQETRNDENSEIINTTNNEIEYVGLKNQGATCYMNSLLQALYHLPAFRRIVYKIMTTGNEDINTNIPLNLQRLFAMMQFSKNPCSTKALTKSFGWGDDEAFMQHDLQEFSRVLIDNLETKLKGDPELKDSISNIFKGQYISFIRCKNVKYESSKNEDFYDLTLQVKGCSNLKESFEKYIQKEQLVGDNQYQAGEYGLQDAEMGVEFTKFPSVLHLHLGRFEYDAETDQMMKINDRFEFPDTIDLKPYILPKADHEQSLQYDLYGVLVHLGSVFSGHYYAFLRTSTDPQWFKFDDTLVTKVSSKEAIEDNYGESASSSRIDPYRSNMAYYNNYGKYGGYYNQNYYSNFGKKYSAYMLVYIRREDANRIMAPVTLSDIPRHIQIYADKQIRTVKLRSEIKNNKRSNEFLVILQEEDLKNNTLMGVDTYLPPYVTDENLEIFDQHQLHSNSFILLNGDEKDQNNYRYDLIEKMRFKIKVNSFTNDIYKMVSERFKVPYDEIRIWFQEKLQNRLKIVSNKTNNFITSQSVPSHILYFQRKDADDVVSMTNDERLIFVKYFFPNASLPIQFVHSYVVKTKQTFTNFCKQVNFELGIELGEDDKMLIYRQYNSKETGYPVSVEIIPSECTMKDVPSGVFIFLQIDPTIDISKYHIFYNMKDKTFNPIKGDYDQKLRKMYEEGDDVIKQEIDDIRKKMVEKRDRVYSIRPSKFQIQDQIPIPSFTINEDKENKTSTPKDQVKILKESELFPRIATIYPFYILEKYDKIDIDIYNYEQQDKLLFKVETFKFSEIKRLKQIIAHGINEKYDPNKNAIIFYTVSDINFYYESSTNNNNEGDENEDKIKLSIYQSYQYRETTILNLLGELKTQLMKKNYRLYFLMMNDVDEEQAKSLHKFTIQVSFDGVNVQEEMKLLEKSNIKVKKIYDIMKSKIPQISELESKYLNQVKPDENKKEVDEDSNNQNKQIFRFYEINNHKYYKELSLNSTADYTTNVIRIEFIPEEQKELSKSEKLVQIIFFNYYEYSRRIEYTGNPFFIVVKKGETFDAIKKKILDKITDKNDIINFYIRYYEKYRYYHKEAKDDLAVSDYFDYDFYIEINLKIKGSDNSTSIKIYN